MSNSLITKDVISDAESVRQTFSSWHNCMSKAYCNRRDRSSKGDYSQMPPTPYGGYQPPAAQMAWASAGPMTATFDTSKKVTEDSLPAMPSWDTARTRRVEDVSETEPKYGDDVEMGQLGPQQTGYVSREGYSQVPNEGPRSPTLAGYVQQGRSGPSTHAYGSDLGAQRMNQGGSYRAGFDQQPGSPAPTYRTYAVAPVIDRVGGAGGASPSPYYSRGPPAHSPSYAPSTNTSTLYEQSRYTGTYGHQATSLPPMSGARSPNVGENAVYDSAYDNSYVTPPDSRQPPSLLQLGRKAVPGSMREV
ncbi:hypothetical protein DV736_g2749, partial [Chaetothyriales sp. CBS 134916]